MSGYRWAFSTITKTALNASDAYLIVNFAVQSDQLNPGMAWVEPQRHGTMRPELTRYTVTSDMSQLGDGPWRLTWSIKFMTPLMFHYIDTNQWPSGVQSAPATIQTFDEAIMDFNAFQVTAHRPRPNKDYVIIDGFYMDVLYHHEYGVLLT